MIPGALNRFVFGKLVLADAGVLAAFLCQARGRLPRSAWLTLIAAGALLIGGAISSQDPVDRLIGLAPRYEGVLVVFLYLGALVAGARILGPERANGSTAWLMGCLSWVAVAVGSIATLETAGVTVFPGTGSRVGSLLGNASDAGAWAVLCLGPLVATAIVVRRGLYVAGAVAASVALACSGSRGAFVGALALAVVLWVSLGAPRQRALVAAVAAAVALVFALPATRTRITGSEPLARRTPQGRALLYEETLRLIVAKPFAGYGLDAFSEEVRRENTDEYERVVGPENPPDSPHDWLLQAAVAGGVPLALLAVFLAALTVVQGWRKLSTQPTEGEAAVSAGLLAGLVGYAVALLFHFTSPGTTPLAAVFAGALLADRTVPGRASRLGRPARPIAVGIASAALFALVTASVAEIPLHNGIDEAARGNVQSASHQFDVAKAWRPWDAGIAALATHVFATLSEHGIAGAAAAGRSWAREALAAQGRSVPILEDAAAIAFAYDERGRALTLIERALALDRHNPTLVARRAELLR